MSNYIGIDRWNDYRERYVHPSKWMNCSLIINSQKNRIHIPFHANFGMPAEFRYDTPKLNTELYKKIITEAIKYIKKLAHIESQIRLGHRLKPLYGDLGGDLTFYCFYNVNIINHEDMTVSASGTPQTWETIDMKVFGPWVYMDDTDPYINWLRSLDADELTYLLNIDGQDFIVSESLWINPPKPARIFGDAPIPNDYKDYSGVWKPCVA